MAIRKENIYLIHKAAEAIGKKYSDGLLMLELGNQYVKDDPNFKTAKEYFTSLGVRHTSIDINGKDGALRVDLSIISDEHQNYFDIVTNYGTSEHVTQQYQVFANIHNWTKVGGAMVHGSPQAGYWFHHGKFNYELEFFTRMAKENNYKVVVCESIQKIDKPLSRDLYYCGIVLIKQIDAPFISESIFDKMEGLRRHSKEF